ncbi:FCD domain-containing protein [Actinomadura sp. DC4]|uniref:GntR family transcriptional regulator n=1 Tax=Actinomadura sp. DC4 TaxID=3055069 RepID=UPI0025B0B97E|nr:FCD domain-containing protein [Actinomadura sp. DC4]MDN3354862.1 FCD domain-containing protein [Actinomadura sp. DC4]
MTAQDAFEIHSLRDHLEALASRLAAEHIDDAGRQRLSGAMSALVTAVRREGRSEIVHADMNLHDVIVELSGHRRLREMYAGIRDRSLLFMNLTEHFHPDQEEIITMHESLVGAIACGDPERAEEHAIVHDTTDGETLRRLLGTVEGEQP